jgi:hypothetical protein
LTTRRSTISRITLRASYHFVVDRSNTAGASEKACQSAPILIGVGSENAGIPSAWLAAARSNR